MQYKTISYKRVKNLGNYQSETVEMSVELKDDDDPKQCFEQLKDRVLEALDLKEISNIEEIAF